MLLILWQNKDATTMWDQQLVFHNICPYNCKEDVLLSLFGVYKLS